MLSIKSCSFHLEILKTKSRFKTLSVVHTYYRLNENKRPARNRAGRFTCFIVA